MIEIVNWTTDVEQQKVRFARVAANQLAETYRELLPKAKLSLYSYPNAAGACPSSQEFINPRVIENELDVFKDHFDFARGKPQLIKPADVYALTPMAEGIRRVFNMLKERPANERAAVFMFGDGQHNCDSAAPKATPQDWYNSSEFQDANIPFFTIPYGSTYETWQATFQQVAAKSGGRRFPADITSPNDLQKEFIKALGEALDLQTFLDPEASITAGQTRSHDVCVTGSTQQLLFSVHWPLSARLASRLRYAANTDRADDHTGERNRLE